LTYAAIMEMHRGSLLVLFPILTPRSAHDWMRQCKGELRTLTLPGLSQWGAFSADGTRFTSLSRDFGDSTKPATHAYTIWGTASGQG
jgi:hypothetical protein